MMNRKTSIFLDTNILQTFRGNKGGSTVFLSDLGIRPEYYALTSFIDSNRLGDKVEICIPEVVVMEMKYHMNTGFRDQRRQLQEQLEEHKRAFGTLADLGAVEIKLDEAGYSDYVNSRFDDFFNTPKNYAKQIPFPKQESILDTLLAKALSGTRPFFTGKIGSKSHSDAETIYEYSKSHDRLCIFVTQDRDFSAEFQDAIQADSKLVLFPTIDKVIQALVEYYGTDSKTRLLREFRENTYWYEYLLNESGMKWDDSVTAYGVEDVSVYEGDVFLVKISFVINEAEYLFFVKFDSAANDFVDFRYQIQND